MYWIVFITGSTQILFVTRLIEDRFLQNHIFLNWSQLYSYIRSIGFDALLIENLMITRDTDSEFVFYHNDASRRVKLIQIITFIQFSSMCVMEGKDSVVIHCIHHFHQCSQVNSRRTELYVENESWSKLIVQRWLVEIIRFAKGQQFNIIFPIILSDTDLNVLINLRRIRVTHDETWDILEYTGVTVMCLPAYLSNVS